MKQTELQKILGERIEKLNRDDLTKEEFVRELKRSKTIAELAKAQVRSASLVVSVKMAIGSLDEDFVNELV